ncbi:MAG: hypothetical protein MUP47_04955 [Phycisphaerae bacterium]|nr:hypothetical protein [Phycisphaerae bacterium]
MHQMYAESLWPEIRRKLVRWWRREGFALCLRWKRPQMPAGLTLPAVPGDFLQKWTDPAYRRARAEYDLAATFHAAECFSHFDTNLGPGSLGALLGAEPKFSKSTAWYAPCIADPDPFPPLGLSTEGNRWWDVHVALIDAGLSAAAGRYPVAMPDLIEGLDTLAALRGTEALLVDLLERPAWVHRRLTEINEAYFAAFDRLYEKIRFDGGNAFCVFMIWGPGRTAKVQCDLSCMISPAMFSEFVVPYLTAQCHRLDYVLYHLDGTTALQHLDALLAIDAIGAVQWTPQAGQPGGGDKCWYDLYRRIKRAGKAVQATGVKAEEVVPLVEAVEPGGLFIMTWARSEDEGHKLLDATAPYRDA